MAKKERGSEGNKQKTKTKTQYKAPNEMKDNNACVANDEWSTEGREPRYEEQASSLVRPNTADTHASKGCRRRSGGGGRRAAKVREHMGGCPEVLTGGEKKY